MNAETRAHVVFRRTGSRQTADLAAVDLRTMRPALFARYTDLTSLRYDFPVVLAGDDAISLSALIDRVLQQIAQGDDGDRVSRQVLRLERQIRTDVAAGASGSLRDLWDAAASRLVSRNNPSMVETLARAKAALGVDGEVVDCDADWPGHLVRHAWAALQMQKGARLREQIANLARVLSDMLRAELLASTAGRSAAHLRTSIAEAQHDLFDFDAMSRVLSSAAPATTMPEPRRNRIRAALVAIESQDVYPPTGFVFSRCSEALHAYRLRLPKIAALARALAVAELEATGEFREGVHNALVDGISTSTLDRDDLSRFPDTLVSVNAASLDPVEHAALMDMLAAGLPVKVLVQWDDLLEESRAGDGQPGIGLRSRQLAHMAIGLGDVFVLQAAAAHLYQCKDRLAAAMAYRGPALISVFSGATERANGFAPYLLSAAAMESRAFPAFTYDPSAGSDQASRFHLDGNSQIDRDWPVQRVTFEDANHHKADVDIPFTIADFAACDRRIAKHLARVTQVNGRSMTDVAETLASPDAAADMTAALWMIDDTSTLTRVLVDDQLMREARRCRDVWHSLQEMGGVHNSHVRRMMAEAQRERARTAEPAPPVADVATAGPTVDSPEAVATAATASNSDDPFIETPRCSTCNECTRINPNMFAYNENKQAFIKNPDGGTYAQLVEAAESCQLAIIHPGKPRNPDEPDLAALIARAEPFQAAR